MHSEALPPDVLGGTPMCMAQYKKLYGYRRPGPKTDSAWHTPPGPESKHIIIFRKGHVRKTNKYFTAVTLATLAMVEQNSNLVMFTIPLYVKLVISQMYKMDVLVETSTGELDMVTPSHMIEVLGQILDDAKEPVEHPVGILTAETRDNWYENREKLMKGLQKCALKYNQYESFWCTFFQTRLIKKQFYALKKHL